MIFPAIYRPLSTRRMLRASTFALLLALLAPPLLAQPCADSTLADSTLANAYRIFRPDGERARLDDVVTAMDAVEVVFVGEDHDDPVAHHLQGELLAQAYERFATGAAARPLTLSMEMFESDLQPVLDEYLLRLISEKHFLRSIHPPKNYETDYKPLVEFAKAHSLPVLAANAPRRYVNRVSRKGLSALDTLSVWAKSWLPPLPYPGPSPEYEARWNQMMAEMMNPEKEEAEDDAEADDSTTAHRAHHDPEATDSTATHTAEKTHGAGQEDTADEAAAPEAAPTPPHGMNMGYMLDAQALWDAAMAHNVSQHLRDTPDVLVLHMVGSFHVEGGWGTPAQLKGYRPGTRLLIVIIKAVDDIETFDAEEYGDLGDFVILTDKSLPRSFEPSFGQ